VEIDQDSLLGNCACYLMTEMKLSLCWPLMIQSVLYLILWLQA